MDRLQRFILRDPASGLHCILSRIQFVQCVTEETLAGTNCSNKWFVDSRCYQKLERSYPELPNKASESRVRLGNGRQVGSIERVIGSGLDHRTTIRANRPHQRW